MQLIKDRSRRWRWRPRLNLTLKFIVFLLLISVLPLMVMGVIMYDLSESIIRDRVKSYTLELMVKQKDYMNLLLEEVESLIANISSINEIRDAVLLEMAPKDDYTRLATHAKIGYILSQYSNLRGLVSIDLFALNGAHYHVGDTLDVSIINEKAKARIFREAAGSEEAMVWIGIEDNINASSSHKKVIVAAKVFKEIEAKSLKERSTGLLVVNYAVDSFYNHFITTELGKSSFLTVVDGKNRILFYPDKEKIGSEINSTLMKRLNLKKGTSVESIDGKEMFVSYTKAEKENWTLISFVPMESLSANSAIIRNYTVFMLLIFFSFVFICSLIVSKKVVTPVNRITDRFKKMRDGMYDPQNKLPVISKDEIGELTRWFNTFLDSMGEKKKAEEALEVTVAQLEKAKTLAEAGSRTKSDFLANMSHELRTPLNSIIGFSEVLQDKYCGPLTPEQEEYLADIHASGRHLLSLINEILDLSKVESGKMELQCSQVRLKDLLSGSLIIVKEKALKHGIRLISRVDGVPETAFVDERKLKQILFNLLSNAVKFTPQGGKVTLTARPLSLKGECAVGEDGKIVRILEIGNRDDASGQNGLEISVEDTGIGIDRKDLNRIFNPFEQVDSSASRKYQGTGLGLSLTKSLVELHGGVVWAESEGEGKGSTFKVILPIDETVCSNACGAS